MRNEKRLLLFSPVTRLQQRLTPALSTGDVNRKILPENRYIVKLNEITDDV